MDEISLKTHAFCARPNFSCFVFFFILDRNSSDRELRIQFLSVVNRQDASKLGAAPYSFLFEEHC